MNKVKNTFLTKIGEKGLCMTYQDDFEKNTKCCKCGGNARIAFVTMERCDINEEKCVCSLHENLEDKKYWLHDRCAVAIYFCEDCLGVTAEYNQA